jgi:hypothetical protein
VGACIKVRGGLELPWIIESLNDHSEDDIPFHANSHRGIRGKGQVICWFGNLYDHGSGQ